MKKQLFALGVLFAGISAFLVVGQMDYEDALAQEEVYCKNVKEGVWLDYDGIYKKVCKKYELGVDAEVSSN